MAEQNEYKAFLDIEISDLSEEINRLETALAKAPDALDGRMKAVLSASRADAVRLKKDLNVASEIKDYEKIRKSVSMTAVAAQQVSAEMQRKGSSLLDQKSLKQTENSLIRIAQKTADIRKGVQRTSLSSLNVLRVIQDAEHGMLGVGNNIQELSLSFTQLLRTEGSLARALSKTFKPLLFGPFAIPLIITAVTLLIGNWDKLVSKMQELRIALGGLTSAQKIYLDQLKELNSGEFFSSAFSKMVSDLDDAKLNEKLEETTKELNRIEEQIRDIKKDAGNALAGGGGSIVDPRVLDSLNNKLEEYRGRLVALMSELSNRKESERARISLGLPDEEDVKKVKDLDSAFESLLAKLSRRGLEGGLSEELRAINIEFDEIDRKIREDFKNRPDLISLLLGASGGARGRLTDSAIDADIDATIKEIEQEVRQQMREALNNIRNDSGAVIAQLQSLMARTQAESIGQFDFAALQENADARLAIELEIIDRKKDALLQERQLMENDANAKAAIDRRLMNLDDERTAAEADNARTRMDLRRAEIEALHAGVNQITTSTADMFSNLAIITAKEGERGLEQNKGLLIAAATADAIAAGVSAVRASLNSGFGPLAIPAAFAAGGAVFTSLLAQVRQIRNAGKGGASGSGFSYSGGFTQLNDQVNNQRIENLGGFRARRLGQNAQATAQMAADQSANRIVDAIKTQKVVIDTPTAAAVARTGNEFNRRRIKQT